MAKARKDSDRRSRQCAKFARLIKIARLVMGNGRCGPADLANEIECSERTIFRDVEILSAAGIPIVYDKSIQAYRISEGFRFNGVEPKKVDNFDLQSPAVHDLLINARRMLKDAEIFLETLRQLCEQLDATRRKRLLP